MIVAMITDWKTQETFGNNHTVVAIRYIVKFIILARDKICVWTSQFADVPYINRTKKNFYNVYVPNLCFRKEDSCDHYTIYTSWERIKYISKFSISTNILPTY